VPTSADNVANDGKRRITIGEYEISLPKEKFPLLGVMACSILLHLSIFIDNEIYVSKYRYGIILSAIAFFGAMVSIVVPSKQAIPLNYFVYILTYAGACITTHETGPFNEPGNGYFASWGLAVCSAIAADPPGSLQRTHFNTTLNMIASGLVFIISLLPEIIYDSDFKVEVYVAISTSGFSTVVASVILLLNCCTWNTRTKRSCSASIFLTFVAFLWIVTAGMVTMRGPFTNTGNGYFSAWFSVVMSVKAAVLEWRRRVLDGKNNDV